MTFRPEMFVDAIASVLQFAIYLGETTDKVGPFGPVGIILALSGASLMTAGTIHLRRAYRLSR